jgi:hypothetical protein
MATARPMKIPKSVIDFVESFDKQFNAAAAVF